MPECLPEKNVEVTLRPNAATIELAPPSKVEYSILQIHVNPTPRVSGLHGI
jgi:hypothetical protein